MFHNFGSRSPNYLTSLGKVSEGVRYSKQQCYCEK